MSLEPCHSPVAEAFCSFLLVADFAGAAFSWVASDFAGGALVSELWASAGAAIRLAPIRAAARDFINIAFSLGGGVRDLGFASVEGVGVQRHQKEKQQPEGQTETLRQVRFAHRLLPFMRVRM